MLTGTKNLSLLSPMGLKEFKQKKLKHFQDIILGNSRSRVISLILMLSCLVSANSHAFTIEDVTFDTTLGLQTRLYDNFPTAPIQRRFEFLTINFQQEISYHWNEGKDSVVFTPYFSGTRYQDPVRTTQDGFFPLVFIPIPIIDLIEPRTVNNSYGDIRELLYTHISDSNTWEIRAGIGKVFWGVTEAQHLVDIINQDDLRADIDGEDKLGQPMINFTYVSNIGNFDFFLLPGFREKQYQINEGRLNPLFVQDQSFIMLDENNTDFESDDEEQHIDFALRWSHSIGVSDIGLSYFQGTNRDPLLFGQVISEERFINNPIDARPSVTTGGTTEFANLNFVTPYYEQMTQVGIDYQATIDAWLLKLEAIYVDSDSLKTLLQDQLAGKTSDFTTDYTAFAMGFEYTFNSIFNSPADLGLIVEYLSDSREFESTSPYQNDVFLGLRLAQNNEKDRTVLIGVSQDLDIDSYIAIAEISRRIGKRSKIYLEMLMAYNDGQGGTEIQAGFDATTSLDNEDHIRLAWDIFF